MMDTTWHRFVPNKAIKLGFKTHKAGRRVRRTGLTIGGVSLGVAGLHGAASYAGSGGRVFDVHPRFRQAAAGLGTFIKMRSPALHMASERFGGHVKHYAAKKAGQVMSWYRRSPQRISKAQKLSAFGTLHNVPRRSMKMAAAGLSLAALGVGTEYVGSRMIKHGFRSHPGSLRRRARSFLFGS